MTLKDYISTVRARLEKATPGPWIAVTKHDYNGIFYIHPDDGSSYLSPLEMATLYKTGNDFAEQDAGLIANAPTDLSTLLAIVEIQAKALEEGSEYSRCDDINGNAGEICKDAISAIQTLLSEVRG